MLPPLLNQMVCLVKNVIGSLADFLSKVISKLYVANQANYYRDRDRDRCYQLLPL